MPKRTRQSSIFVHERNARCFSFHSKSSQKHTSDGASSIVARDPSQGDGGGGGSGDSETRLVRGNWVYTRGDSDSTTAQKYHKANMSSTSQLCSNTSFVSSYLAPQD